MSRNPKPLWIGASAFLCAAVACLLLAAVGLRRTITPIDVPAIYTQVIATVLAPTNPAGSFNGSPASVPTIKAPAFAATPSSSLNHPLPGRQSVDIGGGMRLFVLAVVRPANGIVASGNRFNPTPAAATMYAAVTLQVECRQPAKEKCTFYPYSLETVASDGQVRELPPVTGVPDLMNDISYDFVGGSKITGMLIFVVPANGNAVLVYQPLGYGSPVYFTMQ